MFPANASYASSIYRVYIFLPNFGIDSTRKSINNRSSKSAGIRVYIRYYRRLRDKSIRFSGIRVARELRSDRDGSGRGVTISGVIGEKRRREGVSGLQFRPRLGCLSRVHYCTDNQAVPGSRGREKGDGGSWGWFKRV